MITWIVNLLFGSVVVAASMIHEAGASNSIDVTVFGNEAKPVQVAFVKELQRELSHSRFPLKLKIRNGEGVECGSISSAWIIAIGIENLQRCVSADSKSNILGVLVTQSSIEELRTRFPTTNINAIVLDQPVTRHIDVVRSVFPTAATITVLAGDKSYASVEYELKNYSKDVKINIVRNLPTQQTGTALEDMMKQSDVILTLPKSNQENIREAKWLLNFEYQNKIPVFGFSSNYVVAGAIGATYSTPAHFARQAVEWLDRSFHRRTTVFGNVEYPKFFKISLNTSVLNSLNLHHNIDLTIVEKHNDVELLPSDVQYVVGDMI